MDFIEILPLNETKNVFDELENTLLELADKKFCYCVNLELISKLLMYDKYPIKNKRIAIRNILNFLTYIDIQIKKNESSLLQINSRTLMNYLGKNTYYSYIEILSDFNILTNVPYESGEFYIKPTKDKSGLAKQYRIHNEYLNNEDLCIVYIKDNKSIRFTNELSNLDKRYVKTIEDLDINFQTAIIDEIKHARKENLTSRRLKIRLSRLFYTRQKRYIKKGKSVDRIYHSFTNISRVSRKHFNIKFYDIDIVNCQPLLLVAYLKENGFKLDEQYQEDCENGCFYERFYDIECGRDCVKRKLYKSIFFSFNEKMKVNSKFKELYPITWNSLKEISLTKETLASRLQNLEAELFNNLIPNKSKYYFTLFDAIYFDGIQDISQLNNNILNFFSNKGVKVTTKIGF